MISNDIKCIYNIVIIIYNRVSDSNFERLKLKDYFFCFLQICSCCSKDIVQKKEKRYEEFLFFKLMSL